jgi:coenzyme F420-reducing hydrogenase alpha subunit
MSSQETETVKNELNEALQAIVTIAPKAVEILKLTNERYNELLVKKAIIQQQVKALRRPYLREARPFNRTLKARRSELDQLDMNAPAEKFKEAVLAIHSAKAQITAVENKMEKQIGETLTTLKKQKEQVEERIEQIDETIPTLLGDALVQSLIQQ